MIIVPYSKQFNSQLCFIYRHLVTHFIFESIKMNSEFLCWNKNPRPSWTIFLCPWLSNLIDLSQIFFICNTRDFCLAIKLYYHKANHVMLSASSATCLILYFIFTYNSDVYCDEIEHLMLQFNFAKYVIKQSEPLTIKKKKNKLSFWWLFVSSIISYISDFVISI